jgi:hypothetical protein
MLAFEVVVQDIEPVDGQQDLTFNQDFLNELMKDHFSMAGGFCVWLVAECEDDPFMFGWAWLAKRVAPRASYPNSDIECREPEFMEYRAYCGGGDYQTNWAVGFINSVIAANQGDLPEAWLKKATNKMDFPSSGE